MEDLQGETPNKQEGKDAGEDREMEDRSVTAPDANGEGVERKSKKKTRLQWDEENLTLNALEMERTPRMKIDEPKTPYHNGPASEAGSSTSGSAPGSPAPYFIPKERLKGFQALESAAAAVAGTDGSGSSSYRITRAVQIVDEREQTSDGVPEPNREFEAKRRKHYANEARLMRAEWEEERDRGNGDSSARTVQIVDQREHTADGSPPVPNREFEAKRRSHYANEGRLMRSEWDELRERPNDDSDSQRSTGDPNSNAGNLTEMTQSNGNSAHCADNPNGTA